ncbi:MAG: histidine phosphatase family protein [Nocardioidaceae bacterium]
MIILVRHAMPEVVPEVPPEGWHLSQEGRESAARLATLLPANAAVVSSEEPKAWETVAASSDDVVRDRRFNEVRRPAEPWRADVRPHRMRYVAGALHPGWERHVDVAARFQAAVDEHVSRVDGRPVVIATHGMAMTLWLVGRGAILPADAGDFWSDLRFPDCFVVDAATGAAHRRAG